MARAVARGRGGILAVRSPETDKFCLGLLYLLESDPDKELDEPQNYDPVSMVANPR